MAEIFDTPDLHDDCIHGIMKRTCDICLWGALKTRPYRKALHSVMPEAPAPQDNRRDCVLCPNRGAKKGNRIHVRLPRAPMNAWGRGVPPYPPSWSGPIAQRPRVHAATHRNARGQWVCDRCDPHADIAPRVDDERETLTALDLFA